MKRRIFIAVDLPPETEREVAAAIKQWHWLPIRWLAPLHWHLTLIPPAYFEDAELALLAQALGRARLGKPFPLRFARVTLAPPGSPARMIWLEGETPRELVRLRERVERAWSAERAALPLVPREPRPLHLHATLARFEPGELRELEATMGMLGDVDIAFTVQEVTVMESHLKASGAEYETLAVVPLQQ